MPFELRLVRIGDNATIKELSIPQETLHALNEKLSSNVSEKTKKRLIKIGTNGSPCCLCSGIPTLEVHYPIEDGGSTIERYCEICAKRVYARNPVS